MVVNHFNSGSRLGSSVGIDRKGLEIAECLTLSTLTEKVLFLRSYEEGSARGESQTIVINGNIPVPIAGISKGRVRIGIDAPDAVAILRSELKDRPVPHQGKWQGGNPASVS